MLILVLKMTTNSGVSCPVYVSGKAFTSTGGNPDGFKGLSGLDCNAVVQGIKTGGTSSCSLLHSIYYSLPILKNTLKLDT